MGLSRKKRTVQLERGTWLHSLLETYYNGEDWKAKHKELMREFYDLFEEEREELGDLPTECLRIFRSYLRHYRDDLERYVVVDTELDEIITLPNGLRFQVIVDLIVEDRQTKKLQAWDHKSRKNLADTDDMLLDPQLTRYFYALEYLGYAPLGGVCYNELCTKPPCVPELLKDGGLTQRKNIFTDVATYMSEIKRHGLDPNDYTDILRHIATTQKGKFFRRTVLPKDPPMLKTMMRELSQTAEEILAAEKRNRYPRTFLSKQCSWDCDYRDACIVELHGADPTPIFKMNFETKEQREKREKRERLRKLRKGTL